MMHFDYPFKVIPIKNDTEKLLNKLYMKYIISNGLIPNNIVEQFKKDVELVEKRKVQLN